MRVCRTEAEPVLVGPGCSLLDFRLPTPQVGLAHACLEGRYPPAGRVLNRVCEKFYFVLSGSATVHGEGQATAVVAGDVFHFVPGQPYWVQARGLEVLVGHVPPWSAAQHELLD